MSLVTREWVHRITAELALGSGMLPVRCQITVEWLRGVSEPTWYGYLLALDDNVEFVPGPYTLVTWKQEVQILLRRPLRDPAEHAYPFWGLGAPPDPPAYLSDPVGAELCEGDGSVSQTG